MGGLPFHKQKSQPSQTSTQTRNTIWRPWVETANIPCSHSDCEKTFSRESERRRHSNTVHDGTTENCPHCPQLFTRKDNLTRHIKGKHKNSLEDAPRCLYCKKKLSRQDAVQRHMASCTQNPEKVGCKNLKSLKYYSVRSEREI